MLLTPEIGTRGGQQYDVARAIQTFLHQMAEGGISVAAAVMKELLQNADDAGATEVAVILDERDRQPDEYARICAPALLIRNNAPFRLEKEVPAGEPDDFTALCDVANGHKRAQATAAGRFGIGFNSVYFLTDTPVLFSCREVHIFDLLHSMFEPNGWRFSLDDFPATATGSAGPIKGALEWLFPKVALGTDKSFGELAGDRIGDYRDAILRLPFRQAPEGEKSLYEDRFPQAEDRLHVLREMAEQAAQSLLFLKHVQSVSFSVLREREPEEVAQATITPNPPEFYQFLAEVDVQAPLFAIGEALICQFNRTVCYRRMAAGDPSSKRLDEVTWSFHVRHSARFDDEELTNLRIRLDRNAERAMPWAAIAIPLDPVSLRFDGTANDNPAWRVFLPLREAGPSACVYSAALFVGPSRQRTEFRTDGSDEARRKTEWNRRLIASTLIPLLRDVSMDMLDFLPDLFAKHPKDYLSLFPVAGKRQGAAKSLAEYAQECFSNEPWCLRLHDIWDGNIDLLVNDKDTSGSFEMIPEWLVRYRDRFQHLSSDTRRFIRYALGDALAERMKDVSSVSIQRSVSPDVARAVLAHEQPPRSEDLERLLRAYTRDTAMTMDMLHGLWAMSRADDGTLIRYDQGFLYIVRDHQASEGIHRDLGQTQH